MENGLDLGMIIFSILVLFVFIWLRQRIFKKMMQPNPWLWAIGIFIPLDKVVIILVCIFGKWPIEKKIEDRKRITYKDDRS